MEHQSAYQSWLTAELRRKQMLEAAERLLNEREKEQAMSLSVDAQVEAAIKAKQQEKEVARRLAWIEAQGTDDHPDGTIVRFVKKYGVKKKLYRYVALKADDFWYTTSGSGVAQKFCWPDFLLWLSEDNPEPQLIVQQDENVPFEAPPVNVAESKPWPTTS